MLYCIAFFRFVIIIILEIYGKFLHKPVLVLFIIDIL